MIVNVNHTNTTNVGDRAAAPCQYFSWLGDVRMPVLKPTVDLSDACVVVGGGGLFHHFDLDALQTIVEQAKIAILWGAGTNLHNSKGLHYPFWANQFVLFGCRDTEAVDWVPCASCMHEVFDSTFAAPTLDVVLYQHADKPMPEEWKQPRRTNKGEHSITEVVAFLSKARTVVTNTYHGAYWAQLLGRKVVVWQPFSSRFYHTRSPLSFSTSTNLDEVVAAAASPVAGYYNMCRKANRTFASKVVEVLRLNGYRLA